MIENITGTGYEDLVVMDTDAEGASRIKLLTSDREGSFRQAAVMGLSADRFTGCASLAAGMGAYGGQYLVLDGWTGVTGSNLASVLLRYNEKTRRWSRPARSARMRCTRRRCGTSPDLTSRDLDRDGVVEIPHPARGGRPDQHGPGAADGFHPLDGLHQRPARKSFGLLDEELAFIWSCPWNGTAS